MSQAVLAVLINDLVEQIFCVPNIVNPHSVFSPSSFKQRQIHLLYDPRSFWQYLSSSGKDLKNFRLNGHRNPDLCDAGELSAFPVELAYQSSWELVVIWDDCGQSF